MIYTGRYRSSRSVQRCIICVLLNWFSVIFLQYRPGQEKSKLMLGYLGFPMCGSWEIFTSHSWNNGEQNAPLEFVKTHFQFFFTNCTKKIRFTHIYIYENKFHIIGIIHTPFNINKPCELSIEGNIQSMDENELNTSFDLQNCYYHRQKGLWHYCSVSW